MQCPSQQQSLHVTTGEYPSITVQHEPGSAKGAGNFVQIMTLENNHLNCLNLNWTLQSIFVRNEDCGFSSAISYSRLMSFNENWRASIDKSESITCPKAVNTKASHLQLIIFVCWFFLVEGASKVHLALPVSKLAGSRGSQWARRCPLVSRGDQPHPERHSRHWTHCCPLQVLTGGTDIGSLEFRQIDWDWLEHKLIYSVRWKKEVIWHTVLVPQQIQYKQQLLNSCLAYTPVYTHTQAHTVAVRLLI